MRWFYKMPLRFQSLFRKSRVERELSEELHFHLEKLIEEKVGKGMTTEEARFAALRELGGIEQVKEECRDMRQVNYIENFMQDIRYALRQLRRSPGFTAVVVITLALGIGANTAIFTLLNALVLQTLPVSHPEQLALFVHSDRHGENDWCSYPMFELIKEHSKTLSGVFAAAGANGRVNAVVSGESGLAAGETVTGEFFSTLGLKPMLGRLLGKVDDRPGNAVAVLSYAFWQKRYGGDPTAVGSKLTLNQVPFTVVGVTPPEFFGVEVGNSPDFWIPMRMLDQMNPGQQEWKQPFDTWLRIMGRLRPEATRQRAQAELQVAYQRWLEEQVPLADPGTRERLEVRPGATGFEGGLRYDFSKPLQILMIVVGLVLLIACANIASLLLARAAARRREVAVRLAIGASRGRLIRQFLTESVLLSTVGGAVGAVTAWWGSRSLLLMVSSGAAAVPLNLSPNLRVLGFTAAVSLLTGVIFGIAPAVRAAGIDPGPAIKEAAPRHESRHLDRALVVVQVALSLVLLAGAGLFLRSLRNLWNVNPGYDRNNILMFSLDPRLSGYKGPGLVNVYRELLAKLESVPAVRSASLSFVRPVDDEAYLVDMVHGVDGCELPSDERIPVAFNVLGSGYFSTLGTPIALGRDFGSGDNEGSPKVAIVNETLARRCFGSENPLGRHLSTGPPDHRERLEIVGVVKDSRYGNLREAPRAVLYLPFFQQNLDEAFAGTTFELRFSGDVGTVLAEARRQVENVDESLTMFRVKTLAAQTKESLAKDRLVATLSSFFAGLALLVACIGIYGLMSYAVTRRTQEIGIRMALGASGRDVLWMVLREWLGIVAVGILAGLAAALGATRSVSTLLYGINPGDPPTMAGATFLLLLVGVLAGLLPARRATKVDPIVALRYE